MKRVLFIVVLSIVMVILSSCAFAEPTYKVGYSAAGLIDILQKSWSEALKLEVEKAGGECIIIDSENRVQKQIADIEDLLVQGIDLLAICVVDEQGIIPAIEAANKAGIPVVTLDRAAAGGEIKCHVANSSYLAGYFAGEYIAALNGFRGEVLDLTGPPGMSVVRERSQGFIDAIGKYPEMKVVASMPANWDTAEAMKVVEDIMTTYPDLVGIWAHADAMIMGAIQALKEIGKNEQVVTVGMGAYGGGPEAVEEGLLNGTWEMFSTYLGEMAGLAVVKVLKGETVPARVDVPLAFLNKDNIKRWKETKLEEIIK
jgi:ribose transport system substrate-binding protein